MEDAENDFNAALGKCSEALESFKENGSSDLKSQIADLMERKAEIEAEKEQLGIFVNWKLYLYI